MVSLWVARQCKAAELVIKRLVQTLISWEGKSELDKYLLVYQALSLLARGVSLLPIPLWRLLRAFGSDKQQPGWHSYGNTYGELFKHRKYGRVKLLEIGIGGYQDSPGGRSLLAWQAFFPFGTIVAADIVPKPGLAAKRRRIYQIDQSSGKDLAALCREEAPFDIIIDDGSHLSAHQLFTFRHMFPALKDFGVYVIEDVQTSFWPGRVMNVQWDGARIDDPAFAQTCYGYFLELAKYINHAEFVDDQNVDETMLELARQITRVTFEHNLIILSKGNTTERTASLVRVTTAWRRSSASHAAGNYS